MSVLGIDPATTTGYAYRHNGAWVTGTVSSSIKTRRDIYGMAAVANIARQSGVTVAAIEDCYLGANVRTLITLAKIQERWENVLRERDIETVIVNTMTWKHATLTVAGILPKARAEQKKHAIWVAKHVYGAEPKNSDEADAVCIAAWYEAQREEIK